MEITITEQKENKLLHRKEIKAEISFPSATPSYADVTNAITQKLGIGADLIKIQHVYNKFGATKADVIVFAYDSKEHLARIERPPKEKKGTKPEEKKE